MYLNTRNMFMYIYVEFIYDRIIHLLFIFIYMYIYIYQTEIYRI